MKKIVTVMIISFFCAANICAFESKSDVAALKEKNKALRSEMKDLETGQRKEKAVMYMGMGDAYTKARMYKEAIDSYEESLKLEPNNADAHYDLGLLYYRYQEDVKKAVYHFKRFLKLNHSPKAAREVKYLIDMLRGDTYWDNLYL